ncbi:universal stress protein [Halovivax gelatinilyticus]|uniref:universal stress protein n=1 Tax=Halovivax gelatinilyticus TaxID=2961597 RepID=UPI0020CA9764|nr:universal stress protein [Halovivax gelatinilyticus]
MFETIVAPTDGSPHAEKALADAIELAADQGATVHVISVADSGPFGNIRLPGETARPADAIRDRAQEFVDEAISSAESAGVDVTGAVLDGPPPSTILDYARDVNADLIVMGSRGRGGLHRAAVGSIADHVIRFGEFRVLVVDADDEPIEDV